MNLEDFLAGKPLNGRMEQLMRGEDEEEANDQRPTTKDRTFADGTPVTKHDREHLRRMLGSAGWGVLLKLLDTELQGQEDAARRMSTDPRATDTEIVAAWKGLGADKKARNKLVGLAEAEVEKLKSAKAGNEQRAANGSPV